MALEREIWRQDIIEALYKDNGFLNMAVNADEYVTQGKIVHIPQAGAGSGVVKNRTSLPAGVTKRTDTDIVYVLDEYTSNPVLIPNIDTLQLSYNKRDSVLGEDKRTLAENVAEQALRSWAPETAAQIIRTTGVAAAATSDGATGNRKLFTKEDLMTARTKMNKQNISKEGRYSMIPSDLYDQLQRDKDLLLRDYAGEVDIKNGVIVRLFGFNLMERSTVLRYSNATLPAVKDPGAATAATDNDAVLCWQKNSVERAMGTVDMFERLNDPQFFGDVYSFLVMYGGRIRRADGKGIFAIVQDAAA